MRWRRHRLKIGRHTGLLLCIIKNQTAMMEAMQKLLETYPHTVQYGTDYIDILQYRIDACGKIIEH